MCPFLETIRIENNTWHHLDYHNKRYNRTRQAIYRCQDEEDLAPCIRQALQKEARKLIQNQAGNSGQKHRIRIVYTQSIQSIEITPYKERAIHKLQVVHANELKYPYKSVNRKELDERFVARHPDADDILLCQNGLLTDSWAANLAFFDGTNWFTPKKPLLPGTTRARLLDANVLTERDIHYTEIPQYKQVRLINAMFDFESSPAIACKHIMISHPA